GARRRAKAAKIAILKIFLDLISIYEYHSTRLWVKEHSAAQSRQGIIPARPAAAPGERVTFSTLHIHLHPQDRTSRHAESQRIPRSNHSVRGYPAAREYAPVKQTRMAV
ncbi:MAG TPA: hypothetical protein PL189_14155, partial [bacterium]|nr:hypothetical protein [bacterium]